jgi:small subunit ribosomal protein S21
VLPPLSGQAVFHHFHQVLPAYFVTWLLTQAAIQRQHLASAKIAESPVIMQIIVRDNNVDQALRALKKKLQREGVYREMKLRRHYEKPSERRAREHAAAVSRARKAERKRAEKDG